MTHCQEVIITDEMRRGNGKDTSIRKVIQVFSKAGELIAENDPCLSSETYSRAFVLRLLAYTKDNIKQLPADITEGRMLSAFISNLPANELAMLNNHDQPN